MPGIDAYTSHVSSYYKQSGYYINYEIQQLYAQSSDALSIAYQSTFLGLDGKKKENLYRQFGLSLFQRLVNKSIRLPGIETRVMAVPEEKRGFKSIHDLRRKLAIAIVDNTPTSKIMEWWDVYMQVLVEAGLIKIYTLDDSPFNKFRK